MISKKLDSYRPGLIKVAYVAVLLMLVLLPYYAFLSVWIGSSLHIYRVAEIFKDLVIIGVFALVLLATPLSKLRIYLRHHKVLLLAVSAYILLTLIYGTYAYVTNHVAYEALGFALVTNLQFLTFFLVVHMLFSCHELKLPWFKVIVLPAIPVVLFALLQQFLLTPRFLEHFGYSMFTILPFQYVDNDPSLLRVQSFLRGANPFGAYLVVVLVAVAYKIRVTAVLKQRVWLACFFALASMAMFYTYSRSAWLGTIASFLTLLFLMLQTKKFVKHGLALTIGVVALLAVLVTGAFATNHSLFQKTILHSNATSLSGDTSNGIRASRIKESVAEVQRDVWGDGPGTAGPASVHNAPHKAFITENYYLQLALEIGVIGLFLFIGILLLVAQKLWQKRSSGLAVVLLASLVGISVINMVSHAWTDDTLSLLWWGLAGFALSELVSLTRKSSKA